MRRRYPTARPDPPGLDAPPAGYDWTRFGRHRLRTGAAVLLDHPLGAGGWIATTWADPATPGGWNRLGWQPSPAGGWELPAQLALGDVIEFGAGAARWFGIVDSYEPGGWLTVQGPYPDATGAAVDAERLLAAERYLPSITTPHLARNGQPCTRRRQRAGRHP